LSAESGEEEPLVEVGADEMKGVGGGEAGGRAGEGSFAVESGLAGDVDLLDGEAAGESGDEGFVVALGAFAAGEGGVGEVENQVDRLVEALGALAGGGVEIVDLLDGVGGGGGLEGGAEGEGGGGGNNAQEDDHYERLDEGKGVRDVFGKCTIRLGTIFGFRF